MQASKTVNSSIPLFGHLGGLRESEKDCGFCGAAEALGAAVGHEEPEDQVQEPAGAAPEQGEECDEAPHPGGGIGGFGEPAADAAEDGVIARAADAVEKVFEIHVGSFAAGSARGRVDSIPAGGKNLADFLGGRRYKMGRAAGMGASD